MNKVLVVGGDHHNTLGVIESFGQKGIRPYVILYTPYHKCYVPHSKYVESGWSCSEEYELIACISSNFNEKDNKTVIVATNDIVADILDRHFEELKDICYIPTVIPAGELNRIMSKEYMSHLAKEVGLNVPQTWILENSEIPSSIDYPVITKAISSVQGSKANIKVCYNADDLRAFISHQQECSIIQIQRYIEKEFEFQLLGVSLNAGEEVLIPGRTHIVRPKGLDNTFFLSFDKLEVSHDLLVKQSIEFIRRTGYSGPFSIEFLRDRNTGLDYFTEMNFRNDGNAYVVTAAGTNIPYIYYLSLTGGDYKKEIKESCVNKTYMAPEFYYFTRMLVGEVPFIEWLRNMRKCNCCTTFFKNDKRAFLYFFLVGAWKRLIPNQK